MGNIPGTIGYISVEEILGKKFYTRKEVLMMKSIHLQEVNRLLTQMLEMQSRIKELEKKKPG